MGEKSDTGTRGHGDAEKIPPDQFERIIEGLNEEDIRHDMRLVLKGGAGAVVLTIVRYDFSAVDVPDLIHKLLGHTIPTDLGVHSRTPLRPGHEPMRTDCPFLDGSPCYYEGTVAGAEDVYQILQRDEIEAAWRELESFYREYFGR